MIEPSAHTRKFLNRGLRRFREQKSRGQGEVGQGETCAADTGSLRLLTDNNLKHDRHAKARTACSPRHSYICFRLLEGADIYQVAKNCRTSVEMIEKHYAAHLKVMIDASLVNVRKQRKRRDEGRS